MKIEISMNGLNIMELTLNDFLNVKRETGLPKIEFVRNNTRVGYREYPSVAVTAIIDGIPKPHHILNVYHHLFNNDTDTLVYRLTRFELSIHYIDNPKYDIDVQMERQDFIGTEIYYDANLLEGMIHPILDIVNQIINCDLMIVEKHCLGYSLEFNIFKAILIGITKNPNLIDQIGNMLTILSSETKEEYLQEKYMKLCIAICETIHTSIQQYEIYKCISTSMRAKLIEYFLNKNKPDIIAQLTHFSNPVKIEDIPNDDRWRL
jgi:hypothetical protein